MKPVTEQVKDVRKALKAKGYEVIYCRHSRGTAYNWIEVAVIYPDRLPYKVYSEEYDGDIATPEYRQFCEDLQWEVQVASGRSELTDDIQADLFNVNILVEAYTRKEYIAKVEERKKDLERKIKNKTCPGCGKVTAIFTRRGYRFYRQCECGQSWSHGIA